MKPHNKALLISILYSATMLLLLAVRENEEGTKFILGTIISPLCLGFILFVLLNEITPPHDTS